MAYDKTDSSRGRLQEKKSAESQKKKSMRILW